MKPLTRIKSCALWPSQGNLRPGALAESLAGSPVRRHFLFWVLTGWAVVFVGYYYGTFDQIFHIPFLRKYVDPTLYPREPFFALNAQHYSFFWYLFVPLYRQGILEVAMFVIHLAMMYITFWAVWSLSETLFHRPLVSLMACVSLAFPHVGFAGFPLLEFSLLNRTFVLPFLLWAMVLYLRRRYVLAYGLLGLMYNLHVISVNFVLAMFLFDSVLQFRRIGLRPLVGGVAAFVVCALPVLLWKAGGGPTDFSLRPEWFATIAQGAYYQMFYFWAMYPQILLTTLSGLGTLILFAVGRRLAPATPEDRVVTHFMGAVLIILALEFVTAYWLPVTLIIQLQIMRVGVYAILFGYLYFASYLVGRFRSGALGRFDVGVLAAAMCLSPFPFMLVIIWGAQRLRASLRWRQIILPTGLAALFAGSVAIALRLGLWGPGVHVFLQRTDWYDAQVWARNNTPKEALFITPPHIYGFYETSWRVSSERSTVALFSDLIDIVYSPEYLAKWRPRFEDLAPGALAQFRGDFFENQAITARSFYNLSSTDLQRVAHKYGAEYLVMEKPNLRDFPVMYENGRFIIYAVP
jgi:hypothetical protein